MQGRTTDNDRRLLIERTPNHRHILKERTVVAGWLEAESRQLVGDVRCGHEMAARSRLSPHHRVVGEDVQARHEIRGRNVGGRRLGRVLERK